jgi:dihydroorotate dehydrogenase electron transfer subunit
MSHNVECVVESQLALGADQFVLRLAAPEIAPVARAGEFVMLGLPDIDAMLIRRPFSIARVAPEPGPSARSIDVLYKVFGSRTRAFSGLAAGARMSVLGPLGRGFWLPGANEVEEVVMVAGGIGNAIFPLLVQQMGSLAEKSVLLFGARSAEELTFVDWFAERIGEVVTATEDGTAGHHGLVTEPLAERLAREPGKRRLVAACGPTPMLRAVQAIAAEAGVACQLALEETMACGFGVCLGCVVAKRHPEGEFDRFVRVCKEGPVFDAREVEL